jgi:hypothetical protein
VTDSNSLPGILDRYGVRPDGRALDVGGAAYRGEESVRFLTERFDSPVDVVTRKADQVAAIVEAFGRQVRILETEYAAEEGVYDVVVVSPLLGKLTGVLSDAAWRGERLLRPGGLFITFGIDPAALGAEGYKQPDAEVLDAYRAEFIAQDGKTAVLPPSLDQVFELLESTPRKPGVRSYLNWLVLRRRPVLFQTARPIDVTAGLTRAVNGRDVDVVRSGDFDTLLVMPSLPGDDARARRTAEALVGLGRKILWTRDYETSRVSRAPSGFTRVDFGDPRPELDRRLRSLGVQPEAGQLERLHDSVRAGRLAGLLEMVARPGFVVHSEGSVALAAVGGARSRFNVENPGKARHIRWIHDVRRHSAAALQCDQLRLPDVLTSPNDAVGLAVAKACATDPVVTILDTPRLSDRFAYKGRSLRQRYEIDGVVLICTGAVDSRLSAVLQCLTELPAVSLILLGPSPSNVVKALKAQAAELGVDDRFHVAPAQPEDRLVGYIADADVGVALPDQEADATSQVFTHALAGLPTLVIGPATSASVLAEWHVGELATEHDAASVRAALGRLVGERPRYVAAIGHRPDMLLKLSGEVQASILAGIYARLGAERP